MSILIDADTRIIVIGLTGATARVDAERSLRYGAKIVAGVSPGRGGEAVHGIPVFDTVASALASHPVDMAVIYVPAPAVREAVLETLDNGLKLLLVTAEYVPLHDVAYLLAACRAAGARLIGCNTNGVISPGKCQLRKPVLALVVGKFQEAYPRGATFGHAAAMIGGAEDTASAKRRMLQQAGVHVCASLDDLAHTLASVLPPTSSPTAIR